MGWRWAAWSSTPRRLVPLAGLMGPWPRFSHGGSAAGFGFVAIPRARSFAATRSAADVSGWAACGVHAALEVGFRELQVLLDVWVEHTGDRVDEVVVRSDRKRQQLLLHQGIDNVDDAAVVERSDP